MHAVGAEHVRELVRVGYDRSGAEREHEPCELVGKELRRLEMHVRVDEPRDDVRARHVQNLVPVVVAEPRDEPVGDRDVDLQPLLVKTEKTCPPRTTRSAGSSPRATASRRRRISIARQRNTLELVDVLTPRSLDEALRMKAELPDAVPIQGGTDVMVARQLRPP